MRKGGRDISVESDLVRMRDTEGMREMSRCALRDVGPSSAARIQWRGLT